MGFMWYQLSGGEDPWVECLSEHREKIIQERRPAFVTVLDAHSSPSPEWGRDEYAEMRYSGPFYMDFDGESLPAVIPDFVKVLENFREMGVDLNSLRIYATGGRGFHIEVPMAVFMAKPPKTGVTALPYIYREMAMEMVVDTLDMRVYTGRKGRMWRTPGVERSNGKFKVPITAADALEMTPELYDELCSAPVPEPLRADPVLNTVLAAMFAKAQTRTAEGLKRRSKGTADLALLARFKGQFPPTVERIMRGEGLAPGVGFHKLAMQLAITANALGKSADDLVTASEGLCKNHSGDSARYGSPRKRREELRRMWEYTHDNPCYSYSKGGIRSLCDVDQPTGDLDGVESTAGIGTVPDDDEAEAESPLTPEQEAELTAASAALLEGLMITKTGVHKRTAEGAKTISNVGFRKPTALMTSGDRNVLIGYEAEVLADGKSHGRHTIPGKTFTSRANLTAFCSDYGGIFSGSDTQAGVVGLILNRSAQKGGRVVYALHREGLDLVQNPLVKDKKEKDVVWVHHDSVVTENEEAQYVYQPALSRTPVFYADVHNASPLTNTPDTLAWMRALLSVNSPTVVAQMLGWFVSCFHRQFYHHGYGQFPLLHPNGQAGSGKTMTTKLFAGLNYFTTEPKIASCSTNTTKFAHKVGYTGSASVPFILDEYKPSELGKVRHDELLQAFRLSYNQGTGSSGGLSNGSASSSFRDVTEYPYSSPVAFLGESQEMQTAVVQRSLPVAFNPDDKIRGRDSFNLAMRGSAWMSNLGYSILQHSFRETIGSRMDALDPIRAKLRDSFDSSIEDRQVFNLAVVLAGVDYLDKVLRPIFGDELRGEVDTLRQALYEHKHDINVRSMSEAAKTLNDLALISRTEEPDSPNALREAREYIVRDGYVEILMRETFVKYFSWCKSKGINPYFTSAEAFMSGLAKMPAVMDKACLASPLKRSGQAKVFRFNLEKLQSEGVEEFRTKA